MLKQLSVRQTESLVKNVLAPSTTQKSLSLLKDLSREVSSKIGFTIKIKMKEGEKGKIQISFNSKSEIRPTSYTKLN